MLKSGKETNDRISPLLIFINKAALPFDLNIFSNLLAHFVLKTEYWCLMSILLFLLIF